MTVFPIDLTPDALFAAGTLIFITTGVVCGHIRWKHMCSPFSENEEYYYPARRQVSLFYTAVLMLFPYVLAPSDPGVWVYSRVVGIIYYPVGAALLIYRYFRARDLGSRLLWGIYAMVPFSLLCVMLVSLFVDGGDFLAENSRQILVGSAVLSVLLTAVMFGVLFWLKRRMERFNADNYSNEEDFPYRFAWIIVICLLLWVSLMWTVFLSGSRWVKFVVDILTSAGMTAFLIVILHPQRQRVPESAFPGSPEPSDSGLASVVGAAADASGETDAAVREKVLTVVRRRFREPHLLKSEVLLDVNGDVGKANRFIADVGYYNLVNMFRLEYARLYKEAHPKAKQEEIAEAAGFSSRTAYYKAKKMVGNIDATVVSGVEL